MHTRSVPVSFAKWFRMPINCIAIFFANAFKQVPSNPYFITGTFRTLGKNLEFPLAGSYFSVDSFNVDSGFKAGVKMFIDTVSAVGIRCTDGTVVWPLRSRITPEWKPWWVIVSCTPQEILLFKTEPEVFIIILNGCPAILLVR